MKIVLVLIFWMSSLFVTLNAQCDFNPTILNARISGSSLVMCYEDSEIITTQSYESYQWYKQQWSVTTPNPNPWVAIIGANTQQITVTYDDLLYNFKVLATLEDCSEYSPEILIDGFAYALPYIISEFTPGTFEQISSNEYRICNGADVVFSQGFPALYDYHRWYKCIPADNSNINDPCVLQGINGDTFTATESGEYFFYCCTEYCPNMCQWLGVSIHLYFGDYGFCNLSNKSFEDVNFSLYPNPTSQLLHLNCEAFLNNYVDLTIYNLTGVKVWSFSGIISNDLYTINIDSLKFGEYIVVAKTSNKVFRNQFIKK